MDGKVEQKMPKRILHFSDGAVPEYSDDEESDGNVVESAVVNIDPSSLTWLDWLRFKANEFGISALQTCDYLGESLSTFFGITTPKYQFEIDHYNMMKKLESEHSDAEMGSINTEKNDASEKSANSA